MNQLAFDIDKYLDLQSAALQKFLDEVPGRLYLQFGGKLIGDRHGARVLPGYLEDTNLELIKRLGSHCEVVLVVSAKDLARTRIRGDFEMDYQKETLRLADDLASRGLTVGYVAISSLAPGRPVSARVKDLEKELYGRGIAPYRFCELKPDPERPGLPETVQRNPFIPVTEKTILVISPGGGSGMLSVCLSQLYHEMSGGTAPHYLKFDTFPVHDLPLLHPLNLAYMAASPDFYNEAMRDVRESGVIAHKKDSDEYELLYRLAQAFPKEGALLRKITSANAMKINRLSQGIINEEVVQKEAAAEISRRLIRHKFAVKRGEEKAEVVDRVRGIMSLLLY